MPWFENRSGEHLWYEDAGTGAPIIFLHGWCMSSAVWQHQFKTLDSSFRIIAPDLRGHGRSRPVFGYFDFEHFATDLLDLVRFLGLENVILVGWSMGGQIALQACHDLEDKMVGLVLVSATPSFTAQGDCPFGLTPNESSGMRIKVQRNIVRALSGFHSRMFADGEREELKLSGQVSELLKTIVPPETSVAVAALDSLVKADMRLLLPRISVPALVLNGDRDMICLPQASNYLAEHLKSARHIVFSGCGHAPFITRPEQFNDEITRYAGSIYDSNA